ncbi:DUF4013 domain-containing protein [Salinirubellus salinus]|uniref:DUF4013 domain-containing protein n=1 Tax=Salinirubellus salinus TaxID=1364945 RepID=A0A9E7UCC7_9EURY|nr:DUF4013 domain-containing protein [Salinirubellus salinus]UWM56133.1 DUF4013 domain-containing protein [Salinirubellus salinus]
MFEDALRYPYDEGAGLRALAIGGLLTLLSVLVIPAVLVSGYTLRVLRDVDAGGEHLPAFDDWGAMLVDGLKAIAVAVVYVAVPAILLTVAALSLLLPLTESPPTWLVAVAGIVTLLSVPVTILAVYALPAGLVTLARTGRMGAAFDRRALWPVLTSGSYLVAWLLAIVVSLLAGFLTGAVVATTLLGAVVVAFVGFYVNLVGAYLYARGVRDSRAVDEADGERPIGATA